jgi:tRNA(Arg) A34 adenosine deaminase TadA
MSRESFMRRAIALANETMRAGNGGPFGAVVVRDGKIVGEGTNCVTSANDPTAHAEVVAIREACRALEDFSLPGAEIYTSCEPCPMCLAAIYWARIGRIYYANTRVDAAVIGFDDDHIYREIGLDIGDRAVPLTRMLGDEAKLSFDEWRDLDNKIAY